MDKNKEIKLDFSSVSQWKMDVYQTIADLTIYRLRHDITQTELAGRMGDRKSTRLNSSHPRVYLVCRLLLEKKVFLMIRRPPRSTLFP